QTKVAPLHDLARQPAGGDSDQDEPKQVHGNFSASTRRAKDKLPDPRPQANLLQASQCQKKQLPRAASGGQLKNREARAYFDLDLRYSRARSSKPWRTSSSAAWRRRSRMLPPASSRSFHQRRLMPTGRSA